MFLLLACTTPSLIVDADTGTNDVVILDPITDTGTDDTADTAEPEDTAEEDTADAACARVDGWPYEAHGQPSLPVYYDIGGCGDVVRAWCDDNTIADTWTTAYYGLESGAQLGFEGWATGSTHCHVEVGDYDFITSTSDGYYVFTYGTVTYDALMVVL